MIEKIQDIIKHLREDDKLDNDELGYIFQALIWSKDDIRGADELLIYLAGGFKGYEQLEKVIRLLKPDWLHGFEMFQQDGTVKYFAWMWPNISEPRGGLWEPDWKLGQECYASHPEAIKGFATTLPAALMACLLEDYVETQRVNA